jgi:hypothetical protein
MVNCFWKFVILYCIWMGSLVALFKLVLILDANEYEAMCNDWWIPSDITKPRQSNTLDDHFMSYRGKKLSSFLKFVHTMDIHDVPLRGICDTNEGQRLLMFNASKFKNNGFVANLFQANDCVSLNISISGHTECFLVQTTAPLPSDIFSASQAIYAALDCYALGFIVANNMAIRRGGECIRNPPELFISLSRIYQKVRQRTAVYEYFNTPNGVWRSKAGFLNPVFSSVATSFISQMIFDIKTSYLVTNFMTVLKILRGSKTRWDKLLELWALFFGDGNQTS